jgi:hypothetical protein
MATRADFSDEEWATLQKGITGSGLLVSLSDRDFTDTFGEASAIGKYLAGQQVAASSDLIRELAKARGTGFGITASPDKVRAETMEALRASIALLGTKSPGDVEGYRALVLGLDGAVAEAKGGTKPVETAMIDEIRGALGAS